MIKIAVKAPWGIPSAVVFKGLWTRLLMIRAPNWGR